MWKLIGLVVLVSGSVALGQGTGWRGNGTGLYPDAQVPLEWGRRPTGLASQIRYQATAPAAGDEAKAPLMQDGLIVDYRVAGPFDVADTVQDFDKPQLADEAAARPDATWKPLQVKLTDRYEFGTTELEWTDLSKAVEVQPNRIAYAHTWLYAPRAGRLRAVVDHAGGLKVWANGKALYSNPRRETGLGSFAAISRCELDHTTPHSPAFDFDVQAGWNRLLFKVASHHKEPANELKFALRLQDAESTPYEDRNIRWAAELPGRGNGTPLIVGDRIFVMAEPDQLVCLDRSTGRILWNALNNPYEAVTPAQRQASPALFQRVDPLVAQLRGETDREKREALRRQIQQTLEAADKKTWTLKLDGHLASHFGIVGFATPSPCTDGQRIYTWFGNGIAACYELDGRRVWIRRISKGMLFYASSPALIGHRFVIYMGKMIALDPATGETLWEQPEVDKNNGALLPARLAGTDVIVSQKGEIVRAADGKLLWIDPNKASGDSGWAPPVIRGDTICLPKFGCSTLMVIDCAGCSGEEWKPQVHSIEGITDNRKADGSWIDRWTCGSPLVHEGMAYETDIYSCFYAIDLEKRALAYRRDLDLRGLFNYVAVPVAASPTLIGKYLYVCDNQGTVIVLEPGRQFREVARNRIATQVPRIWPIRPQETLSYAPPVTDGQHLFFRGERYLYCIGR